SRGVGAPCAAKMTGMRRAAERARRGTQAASGMQARARRMSRRRTDIFWPEIVSGEERGGTRTGGLRELEEHVYRALRLTASGGLSTCSAELSSIVFHRASSSRRTR